MTVKHEMVLVTGTYPDPVIEHTERMAFEAQLYVQVVQEGDRDETAYLQTCITNSDGMDIAHIKLYRNWAKPLGLLNNDEEGAFNLQLQYSDGQMTVALFRGDEALNNYRFFHPSFEPEKDRLMKLPMDKSLPTTYHPLKITIKPIQGSREDCACKKVVSSRDNCTELKWTFI